MPAPVHIFPAGFVWGAATSAYQIEGAYQADGKGESIWDRFTHTPGKIEDGTTGDVACDHYHRWREDIALMVSLGLKAYRLSINWPRVLPGGYGKVNPAGLDFYSRVIDGLLGAGITPYVTLYHWDLPQALEERGGWPARDTAKAFAEFAEVIVRRLGDRVGHWMTINEPWVCAHVGYEFGTHAPGHRDRGKALAAAHHLLLGHGWAVPVIRRDCPAGQVGIVLNLTPQVPESGSELDELAARQQDGTVNRWYLDPLAGREYPEDIVKYYGTGLPFRRDGDLEAIAAPSDYLGVNYYTRVVVRGQRDGRVREVTPAQRGRPHTTMGWEVYPEGLYDLLRRLHTEYAFPAYYVTENGAAYDDQVNAEGAVEDSARIDYLAGHLDAAARAIEAGVPLRGYFQWSLLDNFEWSFGYTKRFGMVYVDLATQQRIPKASAAWYSRVIAENAM